MTTILSIDPEARLEAVRRQLAQQRNRRVVLDLPDEWDELDNAARMRLLQRQAQIQRCELGVVTRNEATRKAARQVGVPAFARVEEAEGRNWRMNPLLPPVDLRHPAAGLPEPPPWRRDEAVAWMARPTRHQARQQRIRSEERYRRPLPLWLRVAGYTLVGLLIVSLLAGFTLYVLPAATITVAPGQAPVNALVQLTANPNIDIPDPEINLLPGRWIETSLEVTGTIPTSGVAQKPTELARGNVVFINTGSAGANIPAGTVVSTGTGTPVRFRTVAPAELPGGQGARVTAPVEAVEPGTVGNVRANTINVVEGALRFSVTVVNPEATFGGGSQLAPVVTQQDRDNLLAQLREITEAQALETLQRNLEPGEWLPPETVRMFIIAQAFSAFNDEETPELGLTLRTLLQGVAVDEESTRTAMLAALQQTIPSRGKLVAESFRMERIPGATVIDRSVQFTVAVSGEYVVPIDPAEVRATVAGLPPDEASDVLRARWNIARDPEIYLDPEWTGILPRLGSRIQVRVDYQGAGVTP
ncbi:MAG: hypothetical protein DCC55_10940 [Chloroflexi bacterium]|nr:MAG: hypothetical protein DCC55_10940 [Chloroflexota bacterium]